MLGYAPAPTPGTRCISRPPPRRSPCPSGTAMSDHLPSAEASRLAALHALDILDTPAEARFDRFTRLAALSFDVPIALISMTGAERQWFKSRCGMAAQELPRSIAFCGHAVALREMLVVEDAALDARFADN